MTKPDLLTMGHSDPVVNPGRMKKKYVQCFRHLALFQLHLIIQPKTNVLYYLFSLLCLDTSGTLTKCVVIFIIPVETLIGYLDMSATM